MKKFKAKKKRKFPVLLFIIIIIILYFLISKIRLKSSNEEFIKFMLNDMNYSEKYKTNYFKDITKKLLNIDFNPSVILKKTLYYEPKKDVAITQYIEDPIKEKVDNPRVYIYNTHQLENYNLDNFSEYNITPNVLMASYLLKGLLNKDKINTIVEEANINDFLSLNGWNYASSYKASRYFIENNIKNNNYDLIIDLHRDSVGKDKTTIAIDGKNYAKILFIIGSDYDNRVNLEVANKLNELLKIKYPGISRGVKTQGGEGYNGVYNQDLSNKMILVECGGNENSIDEVMNTMIILKEIIKEYLGE